MLRFKLIFLGNLLVVFLNLSLIAFPFGLRYLGGSLMLLHIIVLVILYLLFGSETSDYKECAANLGNKGYIKLNSGNTRYRYIENSGKDFFLFINGFPMFIETWDELSAIMHKKGFSVLLFDWQGLGFSAPSTEKLTSKLICKQIDDLLQKLEIKKRMHLIALSLGCSLAAEYCLSGCKKIESLSLLSPITISMKIFPFNMPIAGEFLTRIFLQKAMQNIFKRNFTDKENRERYEKPFYLQLKKKGFAKSWITVYRSFFTQSHLKKYQDIAKSTIITQIFYGDQDVIFKHESYSILQSILNSKVYPISNAGHSIQCDAATEIAQIIERTVIKPENKYTD
ncbi:MAG: alpha/beta hydrolase [Bacteroidales bacterium]|nr:alpha/beta hydrolase [Bacteroidales bacterium]